MRYEPFDLLKWQKNPKLKVVCEGRKGHYRPVKDLVHLPNARLEGERFVAVEDDGAVVFFAAYELFFELPDLPEEERWVWEHCGLFRSSHNSIEKAWRAKQGDDSTFWHIRINRNDGTLRGEVVRKAE
jgi:hypothetical protein